MRRETQLLSFDPGGRNNRRGVCVIISAECTVGRVVTAHCAIV